MLGDRRAPLRALVVAATCALVLTACESQHASVEPPGDDPSASSSQPATSTTASSTSTTSSPAPIAVTPNTGDIRIIVLPIATGRLPDDTIVGCGGWSFPISALDEIPSLDDSDMPEIEAAIRPFLDDEEGAFWPQEDWRVLHRTDDRVLLVHSDGAEPDPTIAFIEANEDGGTWDWSGAAMGGDCSLEVHMPRTLNAVDWRLDPEAEPLSPESTVIHVLLSERECADGKAVGDRLRGPEVVVTDTHVLIAFGAEPQPGAHTCPGNPETPVAIELSGPIGDRVVADGTALDLTLGDFLRD